MGGEAGSRPPDGPRRERPGRAQGGRPRPFRRRAGRSAILLALLAVAIGVGALRGRRVTEPSGPPSQRPSSGTQFGANTGGLFNGSPYPAAVIDAQLEALHATGATVARSDAPWEATEPQPPSGGMHHYDWSFDDLIAGRLASHGLTWLPIVDYSAPWARSIPGKDHSAPDAAEYAAYAAAFAARYSSGGSFWKAHRELPELPVETIEIWNEPDNPAFWAPKVDPAAYANLYVQARAAIDSVAPRERVIVGGLAHPAAFLPALMTADPTLRHQVDGVGIHPYASTPEAVLAAVVSARRALRALDLGNLPLYVTEVGWTTSPPGASDYLSERLRPTYIEQTLNELGHTDCGLAAVLLYAWVTGRHDPQDGEQWFGIHPPGGRSSPDTLAFSRGIQAATRAGTTNAVCAGG